MPSSVAPLPCGPCRNPATSEEDRDADELLDAGVHHIYKYKSIQLENIK